LHFLKYTDAGMSIVSSMNYELITTNILTCATKD